MESIDFFHGTRVQPPLVIPFYDGKAELECNVSESWGQLIVHSLKCGAKYVRKLKRSIGMVYTEKDDLESLVSGSLGLKGVASLDAQISSKIGVELQLSRSEEIEDEFTFEAPQCGERIVALYQLRRNINLRYRDERLFHKKEWVMSTTYWADRIHDNSHMVPNIPECGCKDDSSEPGDGRIYIDMGNVTMTTEFIENGDTLRIPSLDIEVDKSSLHLPIQLQKGKLPNYLSFLAGDIPDTINAKFSLSDILVNDFDDTPAYYSFNFINDLFSKQPEYAYRQMNILKDVYSGLFAMQSSSLKGMLRNITEKYLDAAREIRDDVIRTRALTSLFTFINEEQNALVLEDALLAARAIGDESRRALALANLAAHLNEDAKTIILQDALSAAREIRSDSARAKTLAALIPYLNEDLKIREDTIDAIKELRSSNSDPDDIPTAE